MTKDVFLLNLCRTIIKQSFIKHRIFLSDIYIQEYPKAIQFVFSIYPSKKVSYKLLPSLISFLKSLLSVLLGKNVFFYFRLAPHLLSNVSILTEWLNLKISKQPLKLKRILKTLSILYASATITRKFNRQFGRINR